MAKKSDNYIELMLDSGVFSAWSRGISLPIEGYIDYIKRNKSLLFSYVNMDKIPGAPGQPRTQEMLDDSARQSYHNLEIMRDAGLRPIPVVHQGESFSWLEKLLEEGESYVGVSTNKFGRASVQMSWLDKAFTLMTNKKGEPLVKVHGFGITKPEFMLRYPWYSVDSTTWALGAGFGKIIVPVYENGKFNYLRRPINVIVSGVQQSSDSAQRNQFEFLGPDLQYTVNLFLEQECQVTITEVRNSPDHRRYALIEYYKKLVEALTDVRFTHRKKLLTLDDELRLSLKPIKDMNTRLFFATKMANPFPVILTARDARTRLLSYYDLRTTPDDKFAEYVKTGLMPYNKRIPKPDWKSESYLGSRRMKLYRRLLEDVAEDTA